MKNYWLDRKKKDCGCSKRIAPSPADITKQVVLNRLLKKIRKGI